MEALIEQCGRRDFPLRQHVEAGSDAMNYGLGWCLYYRPGNILFHDHHAQARCSAHYANGELTGQRPERTPTDGGGFFISLSNVVCG